nr:retrovirus-related Pol polyprotein from transposon TNT 1-94 [Tanacetum cinerariifolium]
MWFGNDQFAPIIRNGDLVQGNVTIKRVYCVKGLNHNLFFVGQLCDADLEVAFWKSACYVRDLKRNDLLTGSRGTNLYSITLQETTSPNPVSLMDKASSSQASKDETSDVLIDFLKLIQRGLHAQVRTARTDRDGVNLDKMKEKGDACIFVRLDSQSQANVPLADETVTTSLNELDMLFSPMFDEYFNGSTLVVSESSVVSTTDAFDKRHQQSTNPSTSTTIDADITQFNIQTTPKPTTQAPIVTATKNINQAEAQIENA